MEGMKEPMRSITEQQIRALAPNGTAADNGKKISQKGGFVKLARSADDSFYTGECTGSGKSNYVTSADFHDPAAPVFRCTCPSRQFPCKHSLALLYEILNGKDFETCEIPQTILEKWDKKEATAAKKQEKAAAGPVKVNKVARTKKLKKQLEGLDMTEQMVAGLLATGLGAMGGASIKTYRDLAKQLGDYYLPGPQVYISRLTLEIEAFQKDGDSRHYQSAMEVLIVLRALIKKARVYLGEKLESEDVMDDDSILYEELGGIWQFDRLWQLGLKRENARLLQLSFQVYLDRARGEYVDLGYWADLETGEILSTYNYRPLKALKYVREEDSVFEVAKIPRLVYYPGELGRRVRWDGAELVSLAPEDLTALRALAQTEIAAATKCAKNQIKNTLSENAVAMMLAYRRIGKGELGYVLEDPCGKTILLGDRPQMQGSVKLLEQLPEEGLLENQVLFGVFYYDKDSRRILLQPYSILTDRSIVRLFY